jgi:thymidine kinase
MAIPPCGRLEVICGPMFAGKTTELQRRVNAARAAAKRVLVLKPSRDTRYADDAIVTHTGMRLDARAISCAADMLAFAADVDIIAIDEIHFFADQAIEPIALLRERGTSVIVAGCDIDHFGDLFTPFDTLIPRASEVLRLTGVCHRCGAPSTHSQRLVATTERIIVGGAKEFIATCAACFTPSRREHPRC